MAITTSNPMSVKARAEPATIYITRFNDCAMTLWAVEETRRTFIPESMCWRWNQGHSAWRAAILAAQRRSLTIPVVEPAHRVKPQLMRCYPACGR
jgi:hypothetical protein